MKTLLSRENDNGIFNGIFNGGNDGKDGKYDNDGNMAIAMAMEMTLLSNECQM